MAATTKSPTRRKPTQSVPERPATAAAQFPLSCPKPRQTHPAEAVVIPLETSKKGVRLRVIPAPAAVRQILNEAFGELGWAERRYFADGRLWCAVGVFNPYMSDYCFRDAGALVGAHPGSNDVWKEETSFLAAADLWGAGSDVMNIPPIVLLADQVPIVGITKPGRNPNDPPVVAGYRLGTTLTVDKFLRRPDSDEIIAVQFTDKDGRRITWEK